MAKHNVNTAKFLKYVWPFFNIMHEKLIILTLRGAIFAYFKLKFEKNLNKEDCHEIL